MADYDPAHRPFNALSRLLPFMVALCALAAVLLVGYGFVHRNTIYHQTVTICKITSSDRTETNKGLFRYDPSVKLTTERVYDVDVKGNNAIFFRAVIVKARPSEQRPASCPA